jgi:hypothetical protein
MRSEGEAGRIGSMAPRAWSWWRSMRSMRSMRTGSMFTGPPPPQALGDPADRCTGSTSTARPSASARAGR